MVCTHLVEEIIICMQGVRYDADTRRNMKLGVSVTSKWHAWWVIVCRMDLAVSLPPFMEHEWVRHLRACSD